VIGVLRKLRDKQRDDEGFGLAELMVYSMLSVVVLVMTGSLLISTLTSQVAVKSLTTASSTGQLIAFSVEEGVRNASSALGEVEPDYITGIKTETPTAFGELLRARVAVGADNGEITWQCQAWYFSPETKSVYSATDPTGAIDDPLGFTVVDGDHVPNAGDGHWTLLGEGVEKTDAGNPFFGYTGNKVVLSFKMTSDDLSLVLIPSTVIKRELAAGGSGPDRCY
jgi:hypothetical protein